MDFFNRLNYSLGNEDWSVEERALRVNSGDHVVCVTASGDRPLHLLMTDCARITSIDMDHIQNFLLELKIAALAHLDYEKYLAFLGCTPTTHRYTIFAELKPYLSSKALDYWSHHKKMIEKGVIYQGRVERVTHLIAKVLQVFNREKINTLFSFRDLDEQRAYLANEWNSHAWEKLFEVALHPSLSKFILKDPGLNEFTEFSSQPGKYIYQKIEDYLNRNLACKSPLLQLVLLGKILPESYFPYLTLDGYTKIRHNMSRLNYETGNVIEFLHAQPHSVIDCFSMSDIASYMPQAAFEKLLQGIKHAAKPDARFCLREFISKRVIPNELSATFCRDADLERALEKDETNFVYRFITGTIQK